jgi:hypothetical protein
MVDWKQAMQSKGHSFSPLIFTNGLWLLQLNFVEDAIAASLLWK